MLEQLKARILCQLALSSMGASSVFLARARKMDFPRSKQYRKSFKSLKSAGNHIFETCFRLCIDGLLYQRQICLTRGLHGASWH
jgi:hypothetical protein